MKYLEIEKGYPRNTKRKVVLDQKQNFETLRRVFADGAAALVDCIDKQTGQHVAVIAALTEKDGEVQVVPFARLFNGNPYEILEDPTNDEKEATR